MFSRLDSFAPALVTFFAANRRIVVGLLGGDGETSKLTLSFDFVALLVEGLAPFDCRFGWFDEEFRLIRALLLIRGDSQSVLNQVASEIENEPKNFFGVS